MTRTDVLKGVYAGRLAGLVLFGLGAMLAFRNGATLAGGLLGVLFVVVALSGRVQAFFWSELLAGLHHLNLRDYGASKAHSERFLTQLRGRPWLKRLIWLGSSSYSLNAEVLGLNNLGAAELALGEIDAARAHLNQAIALDPQCPLPYRNLGMLALQTASKEEAAPLFEQAAKLGLRGDWTDKVVMTSQRRNAALSTTGDVTQAPPM
jgi:tetratricopeptide (TPR) repeat protein